MRLSRTNTSMQHNAEQHCAPCHHSCLCPPLLLCVVAIVCTVLMVCMPLRRSSSESSAMSGSLAAIESSFSENVTVLETLVRSLMVSVSHRAGSGSVEGRSDDSHQSLHSMDRSGRSSRSHRSSRRRRRHRHRRPRSDHSGHSDHSSHTSLPPPTSTAQSGAVGGGARATSVPLRSRSLTRSKSPPPALKVPGGPVSSQHSSSKAAERTSDHPLPRQRPQLRQQAQRSQKPGQAPAGLADSVAVQNRQRRQQGPKAGK
jgi:hypothetical protein